MAIGVAGVGGQGRAEGAAEAERAQPSNLRGEPRLRLDGRDASKLGTQWLGAGRVEVHTARGWRIQGDAPRRAARGRARDDEQ